MVQFLFPVNLVIYTSFIVLHVQFFHSILLWVGFRRWESNPSPMAPVLQLSSGWWLPAALRFEGRNLYVDSLIFLF